MMPTVKVQLSPEVTPESYYLDHKELGIVPDGTGLQILFKVEDNYFVLAGPRAGSVLTVNGGRIEKPSEPFLAQIQEEVFEETFGVLNIVSESGALYLQIKGDRDYPLNMCANHTVLKSKPGRYAYATFSAVCEGLSLEQLKGISGHISPTAHFWAKLGGFLFSHVRKAPQDDVFSGYWHEQLDELNKLLAELTDEYKQLSAEDKLLMAPEAAFSVDTIEAAWDALRQVKDYDTLKHTFQHTVGRFSERALY